MRIFVLKMYDAHASAPHIIMKLLRFSLVFVFLTTLLLSSYGYSHESIPIELAGIEIEEKLGSQIPLDASFIDENGKPVMLAEYFDATQTKPVILTLVYYGCPNLCSMVLNALTESLKKFNWDLGKQYRMITVSIDSNEKSELAKEKQQSYLESYARKNTPPDTWHFLTGDDTNIKALASAIGFNFRWDDRQKQFAHAAGIFIITPQGKLSRVLYGIDYRNQDLKLSLLEASAGKVGNIVDKILLFCYHYDPLGKRYALYAVNAMKVAGAVTIVAVLVMMFALSRIGNKPKNVF